MKLSAADVQKMFGLSAFWGWLLLQLLLMGVLSVAFMEGLEKWFRFGELASIAAFVAAASLAMFLRPMGSLPLVVIAYYGATRGWHWEWWQAALLCFPYLAVSFAIVGIQVVTGVLFNWRKHRKIDQEPSGKQIFAIPPFKAEGEILAVIKSADGSGKTVSWDTATRSWIPSKLPWALSFTSPLATEEDFDELAARVNVASRRADVASSLIENLQLGSEPILMNDFLAGYEMAEKMAVEELHRKATRTSNHISKDE